MIFKRNLPLPKLAKDYIKAHIKQHPVSARTHRKIALSRFHQWLDFEELEFSQLDQDHLIQFNKSMIKEGLKRVTRNSARCYVQSYFIWLHKKNILKVEPQIIFPRMKIKKNKIYKVTLPKKADAYLLLMSTQCKPSTLMAYKVALRSFYDYLKRKNLTLRRLGRSHMEEYMIELKKNGFAESTRSTRLINIRMYLRWLNENGFFKLNPDRMIRNRDLPKIPEKLPRYLSHEADSELQGKLLESQDIFHLGFLLMRWTGLRIGELQALRFNCVRQDSSSQSFLKVELGKLNTERLVPINIEALELIYKIKNKTRSYTKDPLLLIHRPSGKVPLKDNYFEAFAEITDELKNKTPIVPHQMRHTYATELLNAGMNISVIKELLGHKSTRMTALYAKVSLKTVVEEYNMASKIYQQKYVVQKLAAPLENEPKNLHKLLSDLILTLKKTTDEKKPKDKKELNLIARRLKRIEKDLKKHLIK